MGRAYAGRLGLVAFLTAIGHGLVHRAAADEALWRATLAMFAFAAIGYIAGELAGWIVQDSVRASLVAEMERQQAPTTSAAVAKKP
jgi:hypothetical protein